jgi:hypothetical protein
MNLILKQFRERQFGQWLDQSFEFCAQRREARLRIAHNAHEARNPADLMSIAATAND